GRRAHRGGGSFRTADTGPDLTTSPGDPLPRADGPYDLPPITRTPVASIWVRVPSGATNSSTGPGGPNAALGESIPLSARTCTPSGVTPFVAVSTRSNVPGPVGVPPSVAGPSPLSVNVTPAGRSPAACSGDTYAGVPAISPLCVRLASSTARARPKSDSLTRS